MAMFPLKFINAVLRVLFWVGFILAGGSCMNTEVLSTNHFRNDNGQPEKPLPIATETVLRTRLIDIPSKLQDLKELQPGEIVVLHLFPDAEYQVRVKTVSKNIVGTITVTAETEGYASGSMIAVSTEGQLLITINIPAEGKYYIIKYDSHAGAYRVDQILMKELPLGNGKPPPQPLNGAY